jgi:glycosyltransferase involved in cell wall biosynthesis
MISIVIPMYNEEESIERMVRDTDSVLRRYPEYEILVMNDMSDDGSLRICERLQGELKNLRVFTNPRRSGKTLSVIRGFNLSRGDVVGFIDADYQYDPKDIPKVVESVMDGYDIATGARTAREDPLKRILFSKGFNAFNRLMFGIRARDINCGLKAFRKESFMRIRLRYVNAKWFIDTEILARAIRLGLRVTETQISHHPRKSGRSKINLFGIVYETVTHGFLLKLELLAQ